MLVVVLSIAVAALILILIFLVKKILALRQQVNSLRFDKSSQSVRYGKITEQFLPFMDDFPFEPDQFRFLGSPIDGIAFGEDGITFCEFKAGKSKLNEKQRRIKALVEEKKVKWKEFCLK